eukprot:scaffold25231_cov57-Phaeocystis_antarctica.AAC.1
MSDKEAYSSTGASKSNFRGGESRCSTPGSTACTMRPELARETGGGIGGGAHNLARTTNVFPGCMLTATGGACFIPTFCHRTYSLILALARLLAAHIISAELYSVCGQSKRLLGGRCAFSPAPGCSHQTPCRLSVSPARTGCTTG